MAKQFKHKRFLCIYFILVAIFLVVQLLLITVEKKEDSFSKTRLTSDNSLVNKGVNFDSMKHTLVFFHIQKTSGTNFDQELVENLMVRNSDKSDWSVWKRSCDVRNRFFKNKLTRKLSLNKTYECFRPHSQVNWILSWHNSFGWQCGLHPGLSDLRDCIQKKAYRNPDERATENDFHYLSFLREPTSRFINEYMHVQKYKSAWIYEIEPKSKSQTCLKNYFEKCVGKNVSSFWNNITLERFVSFDCNLGFNRQTRMLASFDPNFTVCDYLYHQGMNNSYDQELFNRGVQGLHSLSWFGLLEYQEESRKLFQENFNKKFLFRNGPKPPRLRKVDKRFELIQSTIRNLSATTKLKIERLNSLDIRLYQYAVKLFFERLKIFNVTTTHG